MRVAFVLTLLATMSAGLSTGCVSRVSQNGTARPDTATTLVGTWRLVSFDSRTTGGEIRHQLGRAPRGQLLYDVAGHMSAQLMDPERPQFAFGDLARGSDAEVRAACDAAYATEFVERLPEHYDSYLGERGVRLSGGQRQRLAIARAILADRPILLLDEATSALDAESERVVQLALERLMAGRSVLIIAHRLATVRHADRIAVMDGGRLVAVGTHDALLGQSPLYARLAALQFAGEGNAERAMASAVPEQRGG
jgi:hypothetical protein